MKLIKCNPNKTTITDLKKIFNFLNSHIKNSIFGFFGFNFFIKIIKINYNFMYYIKENNKILTYISYVNNTNERLIKNEIIKYLLKSPIKNILGLVLNIKFFFKFHLPPKKYLQLMHLIINCKNPKKKSNINKIISKLHNQVINSKYVGIYAMHDRKNIAATNYYKKNKFKIYKKNFFFTFVKKKLNNFNIKSSA